MRRNGCLRLVRRALALEGADDRARYGAHQRRIAAQHRDELRRPLLGPRRAVRRPAKSGEKAILLLVQMQGNLPHSATLSLSPWRRDKLIKACSLYTGQRLERGR